MQKVKTITHTEERYTLVETSELSIMSSLTTTIYQATVQHGPVEVRYL
jgi:hypothetical protein